MGSISKSEVGVISSSNRSLALDGVRGLAILLVIMMHFYRRELFHPFPVINMVTGRVASLGVYGVELFFVLSGFLITGILVDHKDEPRSLITFYLRRGVRIFPLFYSILIILFFIVPKFADMDQSALDVQRYQGWIWTYMMNWPGLPKIWDLSDLFWVGHFWSLCVEEQYYLLWPAVVYLIPRRYLWTACVGLVGLGMVSRGAGLIFDGDSPIIFKWDTFLRIDGLAIGSLIALALRQKSLLRLLPGRRTIRWGYLVLGMAMIGFVALPRGFDRSIYYVANGLIVVLLFGALVLEVVYVNPNGRLSRVLSNRMLVAFGKYSYGLYVIHGVIRPILIRLTNFSEIEPNLFRACVYQAGYYIIATVISFALALLSFHLMEKHFLGLKKYFEYGAPGKRISTESPAKA